MHYVMSDLHGEYEKYIAMLQKIHFQDDDTLYILGDVVDRGPQPIEILRDMMSRFNVYPILGNHELMAVPLLEKLNVEITDDNYDSYLDQTIMAQVIDWQFNGGHTTMDGFRTLTKEQRLDIIDYLKDFSWYETADIGSKSFIMVHAGLGNFQKSKKLSDYSVYELACCRPNLEHPCFDDENIFIISGHTPTLAISGKAEIYHSHNHICIDCGATFRQGRLACLCLETFEEFYI